MRPQPSSYAHDSDRVNQCRLDRLAQLDSLFNVGGQSLQNGVQDTAGFAGLDHVHSEVVEYFRMTTHRIRQRGAAFHGAADVRQHLLESSVLLVGRKDFETLNERQSGIDHDGELAEEDGQLLSLDFAFPEGGECELLALFLDRSRSNALAAELSGEDLFVLRDPFTSNFLTCGALTRKCEYRHCSTSVGFQDQPEARYARTISPSTTATGSLHYRLAVAVLPAGRKPCPRLIMSCNSSAMDERASAVSSVICFWKYSVASDWLKVCIPNLSWPDCIDE